jgi:uracil-DNA glycosylase
MTSSASTGVIQSIGGGWGPILDERLRHSERQRLEEFLAGGWSPGGPAVYPRREQVFRALEMTPLADVRAVILGQDPYPTEGQACGLAFSVPEVLPAGVRRPQSLGRILTELRREGFGSPKGATLKPWTGKRGVLLLNAALTYGIDGLDHGELWRPFTTAVIQTIVGRADPAVFLLWGKKAQEWCPLVKPPHTAVCSPHPMARGRAGPFARSCPFSRANTALGNEREIEWGLEWAREPGREVEGGR